MVASGAGLGLNLLVSVHLLPLTHVVFLRGGAAEGLVLLLCGRLRCVTAFPNMGQDFSVNIRTGPVPSNHAPELAVVSKPQ